MKDYNLSLKPDQFDIVEFYPSTAIVITRVLSQDPYWPSKEHQFLSDFTSKIIKKAESMGIKIDNESVLGLKRKRNIIDNKSFVDSIIYLGKCDNRWSLGFGILQTKEHVKYFNTKGIISRIIKWIECK